MPSTQIAIFFALLMGIIALALFLSLKQRWLDGRRTIIIRSVIIWLVASIIVVIGGAQLLGAASLGLFIGGPSVVVLLAGIASAAR